MAAIKGIRADNNDGTVSITWTSVTTSDTGAPVSIGDIRDPVVHVVGSGTAQMRGSNDGSNFVNMGSALAANSLNAVSPTVKYIDFSTIASATVTIVLHGKRQK